MFRLWLTAYLANLQRWKNYLGEKASRTRCASEFDSEFADDRDGCLVFTALRVSGSFIPNRSRD